MCVIIYSVGYNSRKDTPHQNNGYEKHYSYPTQAEMMYVLKGNFPKQYAQIVAQFRSSDKAQERLSNNFNKMNAFSSGLRPSGFMKELGGANSRHVDRLLHSIFPDSSGCSR